MTMGLRDESCPDGWEGPPPGALTDARRALGWTQVELAARLGVTGRAVQKWERGGRMPWPTWLLVRDAAAEAAAILPSSGGQQ